MDIYSLGICFLEIALEEHVAFDLHKAVRKGDEIGFNQKLEYWISKLQQLDKENFSNDKFQKLILNMITYFPDERFNYKTLIDILS